MASSLPRFADCTPAARASTPRHGLPARIGGRGNGPPTRLFDPAAFHGRGGPMTVSALKSPTTTQPVVSERLARHRDPNRVHSGQIVATELAAALLLVGALWGMVGTVVL